jgi:hypothetical protein
MLYAAIAMGYIYQGPPFRWSYLGLGEPLCFLAFGPLATCAFYFAQVPPAQAVFNKMVVALSCLVGITTTVILFCAHFHQVEGDAAAGKMSPLVRLGTKKGTEVSRRTGQAPPGWQAPHGAAPLCRLACTFSDGERGVPGAPPAGAQVCGGVHPHPDAGAGPAGRAALCLLDVGHGGLRDGGGDGEAGRDKRAE